MTTGKKTRQLPLRGGLADLDKSQRTIVDYSKATPLKPEARQPNVLDLARQASHA